MALRISPALAVALLLTLSAATFAQKRFYRGGRECVAHEPQERALLDAVNRGRAATVQGLLRVGANPNAKDDCGISALALAASDCNAEIVGELIRAGADVNVVSGFSPGPPLRWAIDESDLRASDEEIYRVIKLLAEAGADLNWRDKSGRTALILAADKGLERVVELLIAAGADVNVADNSERTAYSYAAEYGHKRIKSLLVAARAKADVGVAEYIEEFGENAFIQAASAGRTDIVEALLARGVNVNFRSQAGVTALMRVGNESTLNALLAAGADVNIRDKVGFTALTWAAVVGDAELIKRLIKAGADVNAVTAKGQTLLSLAKPEVQPLLIAAGAKR